jgi:hypothetical protein
MLKIMDALGHPRKEIRNTVVGQNEVQPDQIIKTSWYLKAKFSYSTTKKGPLPSSEA